MAAIKSDTAVLLTGKPGDRGRCLTHAGIVWLETQSAAGRDQHQIAAELGITHDRLHRAIKADPKAVEAWRAGTYRSRQAAGALVVPSAQGRALAITGAGLEQITELARHGISQKAIAALMGVPKATFQDALERQPEAKAAWELGLAQVEQTCIARLERLADEGSIAAAIFLAKNHAGMSDTGPRDGGKVTTNVQIVLPGAMSREQYTASIETSGDNA